MDPDTQLTVDLYVRADAPAAQRRRKIVERLERAERRGGIVDFAVHCWPRAISLDRTVDVDEGGVEETVRTFETWAQRHGRRISPCFDVRRTRSTILEESDERLVLPVLCVAAYDEDGLVGMAPCRDGDSALTVEDVLDAIATGDLHVAGAARPAADEDRLESTAGADRPASAPGTTPETESDG
jgi:hypothetical protein